MTYSKKQIKLALKTFNELKSATATIRKLGWPKRSTLYRWINCEDAKHQRTIGKFNQRYPNEIKRLAIQMVQDGSTCLDVAKTLGVGHATTVYNWLPDTIERAKSYPSRLKKENRMAERKQDFLDAENPDETPEQKIARLELENDILREVVGSLKAEGLEKLTNREKTAIVNDLRRKTNRSLKELIGFLKISKSSYEYQCRALEKPDKYAEARIAIVEEFKALNCANGYRYVQRALRARANPILISEKVTRRLMAEEGLTVIYYKKRKRKYNSYAGEISDAPPNKVKRNFHADAPNKLWLTDITEFALPDESRKIYLSPILDCFDGGLASWAIGTRPSAELANSSLSAACAKLKSGEAPICHSDRGCQYRWPGWIGICEKNNVTRSMSKKGCSPDNSAMEGFFGRLKNEFFYYRNWKGVTAEEFIEKLDAWLEYYNTKREKSSLGWMSPMSYRASLNLVA